MTSSNRFCHFGGWSGHEPVASDRGAAAPGGAAASSGGGQEGRPAGRTTSASPWIARPARPEDFEAWEELFAGYCEFYERPSTAEHRRLVWSWIEAGTIHCRLAVPAAAAISDDAGSAAGSPPAESPAPSGSPAAASRPSGLAHLRPVPSPLRGATTGYLDDLFIAPAARGTGAFECLIVAIRELAAAEGWATVRWITAADNHRARAAYDRVATTTDWVTYQLDL